MSEICRQTDGQQTGDLGLCYALQHLTAVYSEHIQSVVYRLEDSIQMMTVTAEDLQIIATVPLITRSCRLIQVYCLPPPPSSSSLAGSLTTLP